MKGIDVSHYQGVINWAKVKAAGYEFGMIKATFGWDNDAQIDPKMAANIAGCEAAGLPYGFYHYSYAESPEDAVKEAEFFLRHIAPYKPTMPVAFDFEEPFQIGGTKNGVTYPGYSLEKQLCIIEAFLGVIEKAGYFGMIYMSAYYLQKIYNYAPARVAKFAAWVAQYASACTYTGKVGIWQHGVMGFKGVKGKDFTIDGVVPGLCENCDVNVGYLDYPSIIKGAGLNGWGKAAEPKEEPDYKALYETERAERERLQSAYEDANAKLEKIYQLTKPA